MQQEVATTHLERKLDALFKQHDVILPRDLRASLVGLIAGEKAATINQTLSDVVSEYSRYEVLRKRAK